MNKKFLENYNQYVRNGKIIHGQLENFVKLIYDGECTLSAKQRVRIWIKQIEKDNHSKKKFDSISAIEKSKSIYGDKFDYSKFEYVGAKNFSTFVCRKHNLEFNQRLDNHWKYNGCKLCKWESIDKERISNKLRKEKTKQRQKEKAIAIKSLRLKNKLTKKRFVKKNIIRKSITIHGNVFNFSKVIYKDRYDKFLLICKACGKEFLTSKNNLINDKIGCSFCSVNSKGEKNIAAFFDMYNIKYVKQYTIAECIYNKALCRFDFYLPDYNMIIEYHGKQHFEFVEYFHRTQEGFNKQKNVDRYKKEFALTCGYAFKEICYDHNVDFELEKIFLKKNENYGEF